jgi:hypothetical protein
MFIYLQIGGLMFRRFLKLPAVIGFYMALQSKITSEITLGSALTLGHDHGLTPTEVLFELSVMLKADILRTTPSMPVKKEDHSLAKIPGDLLTLGLYTACVAHEPFAKISPNLIQQVHFVITVMAGDDLPENSLALQIEDEKGQIVEKITIGSTIVDTNLVLKDGFPKQIFEYTRMALIPLSALG